MDKRLTNQFLAIGLLLIGLSCHAKIGVDWQMQLGNPTGATQDRNNHEHYLIQRSVFAEDYDDKNGEPNWVSWDLTADDMGPAKRSPAFHADTELPASFHHTTSAEYKQSGFDRGHMCPSADRTDNSADNDSVFTMANIIPQTPDNNQGVWEHLEADCRDWAKQGNELLIICGPAGFAGSRIPNGPVLIPSHTWKIVVVVPIGPGPVLSRITASTRVIAVDIPNISGVRKDPWTKDLASVNELEALTGLKFFTALAPDIATILKAKIDGRATPTIVQVVSPQAKPAPSNPAQQINWVLVGIVVLAFLLVCVVAVLVLFISTRGKK